MFTHTLKITPQEQIELAKEKSNKLLKIIKPYIDDIVLIKMKEAETMVMGAKLDLQELATRTVEEMRIILLNYLN